MKRSQRTLATLSEGGAARRWSRFADDGLVLGAIGELQFKMISSDSETDADVPWVFEPINIVTARWIRIDDEKQLAEFREQGL